jgi:hypothetical protein
MRVTLICLFTIFVFSVRMTFAQKVHEVVMWDTNYFDLNPDKPIKYYLPKYLEIRGPQLKDSLPDGIYRIFFCKKNINKKKYTYLTTEVIYKNFVRDGRQVDYDYYFDSKNRPVLSGFMITDYKCGKVDGIFAIVAVSPNGNYNLTRLSHYKNDSLNGITWENIDSKINIFYYKDNEVIDTVYSNIQLTNEIFNMVYDHKFYREDYLSVLLKKNKVARRYRRLSF